MAVVRANFATRTKHCRNSRCSISARARSQKPVLRPVHLTRMAPRSSDINEIGMCFLAHSPEPFGALHATNFGPKSRVCSDLLYSVVYRLLDQRTCRCNCGKPPSAIDTRCPWRWLVDRQTLANGCRNSAQPVGHWC